MVQLKGFPDDMHDPFLGRGIVPAPLRRAPTRENLLRALFGALDEQGIRYCVLHSYEGLPSELPSDLDLAVHPADLARLPSVLQTLCERDYRLIQRFNYAVKAYYYVFAWAEGQELNFLAVDIIGEHRRRGLILASGELLVARRQRQGDFWIPDPSIEFAYLLAKKTLKGTVSARQERALKLLVGKLSRSQAEEAAGNLFGRTCAKSVVDACVASSITSLLKPLRTRLWQTTLARNPLNIIRLLLGETLRMTRRWFQPTGFFLVLLGPDGVGKSTTAQRVVQILGPAFRRSRAFHWRPGTLWREESRRPVVTNPHGQSAYPAWLSVGRLFAHLLDFWFGYWLVIRPCLARSGLVVFDRYYHDLLVDQKRYRYGGPRWLVEALRWLVPKPNLVLVLDAPVKVILSRKQEVAPEEVRRQRRAFVEYAADSSDSRVIDASQSVPQAAVEAARIIVTYLGRRFQRRHAVWKTPRGNRFLEARSESTIEGASRMEVLEKALQEFIGHPPAKADATSGDAVPPSNGKVEQQPAERGHERSLCFAILPSRKSPRWLLPLGDSQKTLTGFQIYTPYALKARILKGLLARIIKTGWQGWARHKLLIAAPEPLELESLVKEVTGEDRPVFALSLGYPDRYCKLTVQVMRHDGEILGYIKLPLAKTAESRVSYEADVLERLWGFDSLRPHIPKVLYAGEWNGANILFQSRGPSRPGPVEFDHLHETFLQRLWSVHRVQKQGRVLVEEVADRWRKIEPPPNARCQQLGERALAVAMKDLDGQLIPSGIMHGDFAYWNTREVDARLYVFDWEAATWEAPRLWDIFHFQVQAGRLHNGKAKNGLQLDRGANKRALFLLYLLNSLCQLLEDRAQPVHPSISYYQQLLNDRLS